MNYQAFPKIFNKPAYCLVPYAIDQDPFHNFKNYSFGYVTDTIKNASLSNRVPFLDLLPYYANTSPESVWVSYEDAHPNALGNSIAANAVTDFLIKKNLVPS